MARRTKSNKWSRALGALFAIVAITWGLRATAATLRSGSVPPALGDDGSIGTFLLTGSYDYDLSEDTGTGDNIIRLINPAGCGNGGVPNQQCGSETDLCALIYVFDNDQEMGECCGCPITPNELETVSVKNQLTANWGLGSNDSTTGVIQIVSGQQNNLSDCNPAHGCNGGCDPTIADIPSTSLIGSISRGQKIQGTTGMTEVPLQNDGPAETVESAYLSNQCASLVGNDSGGGVCTCVAPPTPTPTPIVIPPVVFGTQSGNSNNLTGDVGIGITVGGGKPTLNSLAIVAIDVFADVNGVFPTVTPPLTNGTINPAWTEITSTSVGTPPCSYTTTGGTPSACMVQYIYWHMIGSGETGIGGPSFTFLFSGDGTPANCTAPNTAGCFRATAVGINYNGTCTEQTPNPCPITDPGVVTAGSPISGLTTGINPSANTVVSAGTVPVPTNGYALGAYGTDNLTDFFGKSGAVTGTVTDDCPPQPAGSPATGECSTALHFENANAGENAGLVIYDQLELTGFSVGPFSGTLPNGDPGNNIIQAIGIVSSTP